MPIQLTAADWRAIFPRAPQSVIDAFASPAGMAALQKAGILETKTRLAYALANVEHECGGFTIPRLTENINYTAARMAQVWPNRFSSAGAVQAKYGSAVGWQKHAFDDIYGNRMGNRPGTHDGSTYIGRGGPQVTGRDGYLQVGNRAGIDLVNNPDLASRPEHQPAILAGFWTWKNLNRFADANNWTGCVKAWNGGTNGMADRNAQMRGNDPIIERLKVVDRLPDVVKPPVQPKPTVQPKPGGGVAGKIIVGGGVGGTAATAAWYSGIDWGTVAAIGVMAGGVVALIWHFAFRKKKD